MNEKSGQVKEKQLGLGEKKKKKVKKKKKRKRCLETKMMVYPIARETFVPLDKPFQLS